MNNIIVHFSLLKNKISKRIMKKNWIIILLAGLLVSCVGGQLYPSYSYNTNPTYTWGYAEFYGAYYAQYGNTNNVISLSLFSDSLEINDIGNLVGTGQYLFLEDVFIAKTDTLLPVGTYTINTSGLPFTVAPGKNDTIDSEVYPIGATISYYEDNSANSKSKLVTDGTFTVSRIGNNYTINCNLKTDDKKTLQGSFSAQLPHIDQSLATPKSAVRNRFLQKFLSKNFGN
jgi:hypothetical protein